MISPIQKTLTWQMTQTYKVVSSWAQLREWHRRFTPSISDTMFRMVMKEYNGQARKLKKQGILQPNHYFMLSDVDLTPEEQQQIQNIKKQYQKLMEQREQADIARQIQEKLFKSDAGFRKLFKQDQEITSRNKNRKLKQKQRKVLLQYIQTKYMPQTLKDVKESPITLGKSQKNQELPQPNEPQKSFIIDDPKEIQEIKKIGEKKSCSGDESQDPSESQGQSFSLSHKSDPLIKISKVECPEK